MQAWKAKKKNLLLMLLFCWSQSTACKCEECYTMDVWYVRCYSRVKVCVRVLVCVCFSERRWYLGLCDESVSVASKVLRAACRLLIHIRCGWLESEADDTGRCWEKRGKERDDKWTKTMCRVDPRCQPLAKQIFSITITHWHPLFPSWLHPSK